jgi:hypothetical protein
MKAKPLMDIECPNGVNHQYTLQVINKHSLSEMHKSHPELQWQMKCEDCRKITALIRRS